jgi:chaperonin GroES
VASSFLIPQRKSPKEGPSWLWGLAKKDEPTTVQVGDTVLYGKYSGTELQHDGTDYMIMRESDILAIL